MPLQDHFHPPLSLRRHWHSFHNSWATYLSAQINERLPPGYFAEANVQFAIEIDVATFEDSVASNGNGHVLAGWQPAAPVMTLPFVAATDIVEIRVFRESAGPTLAGAVELVSPANKDRAEHRDAFVAKCAGYLYEGIGLLVADVVSDRHANLHDEVLAQIAPGASKWGVDLYAVSYRTANADDKTSLHLWLDELKVGRSLPTLPLWLRGGFCLPVDLDAAYLRTCQEQRLAAGSV